VADVVVQVAELELEKLVISRLNVRQQVGDVSELADSIRSEGILQPLLVRPVGSSYEIIVGSRRFAAARQAGLRVVPAAVRSLTDQQAVVISLTENLQRGDLSLEERVEGYKKLQELNATEFGSVRSLGRAIGRDHSKIIQDFDAYTAMMALRPHDIQVVTALPPSAPERRAGEALPERHATMLEQAFSAIRTAGRLEPEEVDAKYPDLARVIAPLDGDDAKRVLDYFKMYPERSAAEIRGMALAKVEREVSLDALTARKLDELATGTGRRWEDVIASLVESPVEAPSAPSVSPEFMPVEPRQLSMPESAVAPPPRYETLELPEESVSEQIIGKTLWNVEQAERAGVEWDFYTIGYSQKTIEQFIRVLQTRGVATLVDVRHEPVSMYKPDFSKDNLRRALEAENIAYVHAPDLGVPKEIRARLAETANWDAFFEWYDSNVAPRLNNGLMERLESEAKPPLAFMCVEQNPTKCHRHRIAMALRAKGLSGADL